MKSSPSSPSRVPARRPRGRKRSRAEDKLLFAAASVSLVTLALLGATAAALLKPPPEAPAPPYSSSPSPEAAAPSPPPPASLPPIAARSGGGETGAGAPSPRVSTPPEAPPPDSARRPPPPRPPVNSVAWRERSPTEAGKPRPRGRLVFVIDDAGHNLRELEPFLSLPFPLTIAVLPGLPYSAEAARRVLEAGKELILHQPMEALGGSDPGPGAILLGMEPREAGRVLEANLDGLPGVRGLNNHMGSAVTADPLLMGEVLAVAKRRGIYYLDSLTVPETATGSAAARESITYWERDVFLDNYPDRVSIIRYIDDGKKKAEKGGPAVMIGHVWSAGLAETLRELYPQLVDEGFSLSTISRLMIEEADARSGD